jgi:hypothetical protein
LAQSSPLKLSGCIQLLHYFSFLWLALKQAAFPPKVADLASKLYLLYFWLTNLAGDNGQVAGIFGGGMAKGGGAPRLAAPSGKSGPTTWASTNPNTALIISVSHPDVIIPIVWTQKRWFRSVQSRLDLRSNSPKPNCLRTEITTPKCFPTRDRLGGKWMSEFGNSIRRVLDRDCKPWISYPGKWTASSEINWWISTDLVEADDREYRLGA